MSGTTVSKKRCAMSDTTVSKTEVLCLVIQ